MGFIFQQGTMLRNLNLLDNIILPAQRGNEQKAKEIQRKSKELMAKAGLVGLESCQITEVFGGQLQRASICRALVSKLQIIFVMSRRVHSVPKWAKRLRQSYLKVILLERP